MRAFIIAIIFALASLSDMSAQCPDYVATNAAETCIGVAWVGGDAPDPLPGGLFVVEAPYIYLTGGGTSILDLAIYTLNGEITNPLDCGLTISLFTGTLTFQDFSCDYINGVLPVTLMSFDANQVHHKVALNWATSFEYQNKEFVIQRSANGYDWTEIGSVIGAGSSDATMEYTFTDNFPLEGRNYYRLKQVDYDGQSEASDIVTANFHSEQIAFPNPANEELTIRGQFELFTINGQPIASGTNLTLNISHLPGGIYLVRQGDRVERIVKY